MSHYSNLAYAAIQYNKIHQGEDGSWNNYIVSNIPADGDNIWNKVRIPIKTILEGCTNPQEQ